MRNVEREVEQYHILKSMSEIYYSMHLVDLVDNTVFEYTAKNEVKQIVNQTKGADEMMRDIIRASACSEHMERLLEFTNLNDLQTRLRGKKTISTDFVGVHLGWTRITFITIDADEEGVPLRVMCTTQMIEEEKRKEEQLIRTSNTDELTQCFNRRAYESMLLEYDTRKVDENLVYIAVDINGLKVVNDSLGHSAGDEIIVGAATCLNYAFGSCGHVYRIGGDEFAAVIYSGEEELELHLHDLDEQMYQWAGELVKQLSLSYGAICAWKEPDKNLREIALMADERMGQQKSEYYRKQGVDRRGQYAAHAALCNLYSKILSIDLSEDRYQIINMNQDERDAAKGFAPTISGWFRGFGESGQVHEEDAQEFLRHTDLEYLKNYFKSEKTSLSIFYRRKIDDEFKQVVMEMIPTADYTHDNQQLYLYVKSIDK